MKGNFVITDPFPDALDPNQFLVLFATPVRREGEIIGGFNVVFDARWLSSLLDGITVGETGYAHMIADDGTDIAYGAEEHYHWVLEKNNEITKPLT